VDQNNTSTKSTPLFSGYHFLQQKLFLFTYLLTKCGIDIDIAIVIQYCTLWKPLVLCGYSVDTYTGDRGEASALAIQSSYSFIWWLLFFTISCCGL